MIPRFEHSVCNEIAMQGIGAHKSCFWPLCGWSCTLLSNILSEEGANKVADVPTGVVQDAILDHMGSDFRCQNEVMTTRNC